MTEPSSIGHKVRRAGLFESVSSGTEDSLGPGALTGRPRRTWRREVVRKHPLALASKARRRPYWTGLWRGF